MMGKDPDTFFQTGIFVSPLGTALGKSLVSGDIQKFHLRKVFQDKGDHTFVFLGREGTGGVEEHSSRTEHGNASGDDFFLLAAEVVRPGRIPGFGYIRILAEHSFP